MDLTTSKYESGEGLCRRIEALILEHRITGSTNCTEDGIAHPIHVSMAFKWIAGYPSDPWSEYAKGFKARVVAHAQTLGINVKEET